MEEAGESNGRQGNYIDKTRNRQAPLPPPTTPLVPLNCASGFPSGAKPSKITRRLSITWEGEGAGAVTSGPLVSSSSQTVTPFQFPFITLDGRAAFFYFQTPSPSISTLITFQF
jgi:hypothetical protein